MGIPIPSSSDNAQGNSTTPHNQNQPTTAPPKSVSDLPPEALSLAARLFDYAREGSTDLLAQYITAGIPVDLTDHSGNTLLMLAAYHDQIDTVRMLLSKGADPNALNDRGQSPLAGAVFKGWEDVIRALWEAGADPEAGHPNARDSAIMFRREGWVEAFQRGRPGSGRSAGAGATFGQRTV